MEKLRAQFAVASIPQNVIQSCCDLKSKFASSFLLKVLYKICHVSYISHADYSHAL